jgi:hypothetical protein
MGGSRSLTVAPAPAAIVTTSGFDGVVQVNSAGKFANSTNAAFNIRGFSTLGLEGQPMGWSHPEAEWGNTGVGALDFGPCGPPVFLAPIWKANCIRVGLNSQTFMDLNWSIFDSSGTGSAPVFVGATATASSTGTSITVDATTNWKTGGNGKYYLVNLTNPSSTPPNGIQITGATGTTVTVATACNITNGDVLVQTGTPTTSFGRTKATLLDNVPRWRAAGLCIVWDLHWTAPRFTGLVRGTSTNYAGYCGAWGQPPYMNGDDSSLFWLGATQSGLYGAATAQSLPQWLAANFGSAAFNNANGITGTGVGNAGIAYDPHYGGASGIGDMIFEMFNEPILNFAGTNTTLAHGVPPGPGPAPEYLMLNGGYNTSFTNQNTGAFTNGVGIPAAYGSGLAVITQQWQVLGSQQVLTGLRSQGFNNIIQVAPRSFASSQENALYIYPTDSLSPPQVCFTAHLYQGTAGVNAPSGDGGTLELSSYIPNITSGTGLTSAGGGIGHPVPVNITECGDAGGVNSGGPTAPALDSYINYIQTNVDSINGTNGIGSFGYNPFLWAMSGSSSSGNYVEMNFNGLVSSFTVSIVGTVMTVTGLSGSPIQTVAANGNASISTDGFPGPTGVWVVSQLSGSAGSNGQYQLSAAIAAGNHTFDTLSPSIGQGNTIFNWMSTHGP